MTPDLTSDFAYDSASNGVGLLAYMETDNGDRRSHTYDVHGRVTSTTVRIDASDHTFTHSYNSDGQLDTLGYPSGYQVSYQYSGDQRALTTLIETSSSDLIWRADERHANGQVISLSLDNLVTVTRDYHPQTARLTGIQAGPNATPDTFADYTYGYDVIGNLTSRYDANEVLSEVFEYDNLNRLTQATTGTTVHTAAYNAVGNLTSKRQLGSSASNTYSYPSSGSARPHAVSSVSGTINGTSNPSYSYDANGNMTSGAGRTLTWRSFNKVASVTEGFATLTYTYDAEHQRIKQSDGSTTVRYLNDPVTGASAEYHTGSGGVWHDYLTVEGQRIGKRTQTLSPAGVSHQRYVQDHLGSVAVVLDNNATLIQKLSYDAWGLRRYPDGSEDPSSSISAPLSRGYTDHEHVPDSRLINMNARLYDPELGRFLSADPFIPNPLYSQAYNRYSYVYNNPLRYIDPSGYNPNCPGCPVIIVTPGSGGFGSGWSWSDWDFQGEVQYWAYEVGGGYADGSASNSASTHYKVSIAVTSPTLVQQNRSLSASTPAPTFEMVVMAKQVQSPFFRFRYSVAQETGRPSIIGFIREEGLNVLVRTATVLGGAGQTALGVGLCSTAVGCAIGGPLATLGTSNIQEGFTGKPGFVRQGATNLLGTRTGNIAVDVTNVGTSIGGLFRAVLKPGSWKLFRTIPQDYVPAYQTMTGTGLATEIGVGTIGIADSLSREDE